MSLPSVGGSGNPSPPTDVTPGFPSAQPSGTPALQQPPANLPPSLAAHKSKPLNSLSRDEAVKILKEKTPKNVEINTEEKGIPMFMFGACEGKNHALNCLYDGGCSDCLMRSDVPENELIGVKTAQGPFPIGAVGGVQVMARDAWMVKVKMTDGPQEVIECLTVDRVTSDFPRIDLTEATTAIKSSAPQNEVLQNVKAPTWAGGQVHILLGIKYNALFPELIHMMPNGLAIYHLKIKSHRSKHTAVIAGPHSSFYKLAEQTGNTAFLIEKFTEGL